VQPDIFEKMNRLTSVSLFVLVLSSCASWTGNSDKEEDLASIHLQLGVRYMDLNKLEIAKENLLLAQEKIPIMRKCTMLCFFV